MGISQFEYERIHGTGSFQQLKIPEFKDRLESKAEFFVSTNQHPFYRGPFRQQVNKNNPKHADLGVWNIFGHPDKKHIQTQIKQSLCQSYNLSFCEAWSDAEYLEKSIGLFRTPTLRSLGQSAPYFHNGDAPTLKKVLQQYVMASQRAKRGYMRNISPRIKVLDLHPKDISSLVAFLESLNEDYD